MQYQSGILELIGEISLYQNWNNYSFNHFLQDVW